MARTSEIHFKIRTTKKDSFDLQKARTGIFGNLEEDSNPRTNLSSWKLKNVLGREMNLKRTFDEANISEEKNVSELKAKVIDLESRNEHLAYELQLTKEKKAENEAILKKDNLDLMKRLWNTEQDLWQAWGEIEEVREAIRVASERMGFTVQPEMYPDFPLE